jgi:SAM-dependent methyltransferase
MPSNEIRSHFADKYFDEIDNLPEADNYFLPVLRDVGLEIDFKSARVLDVGCGTGLFLKPLIETGCTECYGVDGPSAYAYRAIARGYRDVKFVADLNNTPLPFADETFDLVVCKDVFEHLLNPLYALSDIRRVLKNNGLFLFHVPNHFPLYGRLKFLFSNDIDTFAFFKNESRWTFPHIRFYEHDDSLRVLVEHGFTLVADLSHHFQAIPLLSRFRSLQSFRRYLVGRFPNQFAAGFTFLVKKDSLPTP